MYKQSQRGRRPGHRSRKPARPHHLPCLCPRRSTAVAAAPFACCLGARLRAGGVHWGQGRTKSRMLRARQVAALLPQRHRLQPLQCLDITAQRAAHLGKLLLPLPPLLRFLPIMGTETGILLHPVFQRFAAGRFTHQRLQPLQLLRFLRCQPQGERRYLLRAPGRISFPFPDAARSAAATSSRFIHPARSKASR